MAGQADSQRLLTSDEIKLIFQDPDKRILV
jgi:hypothetical protein